MKFIAKDLLPKSKNYILQSDQPYIQITKDGSQTLVSEKFKSSYHSLHGALQESLHVFLQSGLIYFIENEKYLAPFRIFEMGLGSGLNAVITWNYAENQSIPVFYESLEAYPISLEVAHQLQYNQLNSNFIKIHECAWNEPIELSKNFTLHKSSGILKDYFPDENQKFHVIYYDAFAPASQPELWTQEVFEKCHEMLISGGVLSTYCSKGDVRRAMIAAGFAVEKISGPPGKREILRAIKK